MSDNLMKVSECRTPAELNDLAEILEKKNENLRNEIIKLKIHFLKWMLN
tara:strand:- start:109 stop:255 length:147 start_codon:yes stop_codon:yes gene_type:complete